MSDSTFQISEPVNLAEELKRMESLASELPRRININPDNAEQGLAQLVLTIVELLKQLMERQAIRRMEAGSLTDEEIERVGETMMKLDQRIDELCKSFNIERKNLNIDLGILGDLM